MGKIAVITSEVLRGPTEASLQRLKPEGEIVMLTYSNFPQLPALYDQYAPQVDGFLVSGQVVQAAIERREHTVYRPVMAFQTGMAELCRAILVYMVENPGQDLGRVILDFLLPLEGEHSAKKFVGEMDVLALDEQINAWIQTMRPEQLDEVDSAILRRIIPLWEEGQMDVVICLYSSIAPALERRGIPFRCPFVTDAHLLDLLRQLQMKIELTALRSSQPAVVSAVPRGRKANTAENRRVLRERLESFLRENLLDGVLREETDGISLFTTVEVVHLLTDGCRSSRLDAYLAESLDFPVSVGYGVGGGLLLARRSAQYARREAELAGASFLRNEKGELIGPLDTGKPLVVAGPANRDAGETARRCGLSTHTIQKVAAAMKLAGSNRMTAQELAGRFGVTVRNANRILSGLVAGGCAQVVYLQAPGSRGRPVKVYELRLEI